MNTWWFWALTLAFTNLITGLAVAHRRGWHDWSVWSEWTQDAMSTLHGDVQAIRYRVCDRCSKVQRQDAGYHRCLEIASRRNCPHLANLTSDGQGRIRRLEKELGF